MNARNLQVVPVKMANSVSINVTLMRKRTVRSAGSKCVRAPKAAARLVARTGGRAFAL